MSSVKHLPCYETKNVQLVVVVLFVCLFLLLLFVCLLFLNQYQFIVFQFQVVGFITVVFQCRDKALATEAVVTTPILPPLPPPPPPNLHPAPFQFVQTTPSCGATNHDPTFPPTTSPCCMHWTNLGEEIQVSRDLGITIMHVARLPSSVRRSIEPALE